MKRRILLALILTTALGSLMPISCYAYTGGVSACKVGSTSFLLTAKHYRLRIYKDGFRYRFERPDGKVFIPANATSGLQIARHGTALANVQFAMADACTMKSAKFSVKAKNGLRATVRIQLQAQQVRFAVRPERVGSYDIVARTGGVAPAYGLGDNAAFGRSKTELTGYVNDNFGAGGGPRLVSNFVVFPKQGFAEVNAEPQRKIVRITKEQSAQGSRGVQAMPDLYYFIGSPKEIYQRFLAVRDAHGYHVYKPKPALFGVGWEAFGALAWKTSQKTVTQNVEHYLKEGYPLRWMVVGSGFWPQGNKALHATTSFGMWDKTRYPHPRAFIRRFHKQGLKFLIGLRIGFIPGGSFTQEGLKRGYFLEENGKPRLFNIGFPKPPVYMLDAHNPDAMRWYVSLVKKWLAYGVDGFKEDVYGYGPETFARDDKIDPVNAAFMKRGVYIIERNGYLSSPADLHRFDDFNYDMNQDRGPINGLTLAYSGFPYVYPDIVGGTLLASKSAKAAPSTVKKYLIREAQYASVNPSMSFGYGPWNLNDKQVDRVTLAAAQLHARLQPYIYNAALRTYKTGFPYTMTPLPLAYPHDSKTYHLANTKRRAYEWLIGQSLLAAPLYGNDFATAKTRDLYLPKGIWVDYDTGRVYKGPKTLKDFPLPAGKTPLFVGGKGIIVERQKGRLEAFIYPIAHRTAMTFNDASGKTSTIKIDVSSWKNSHVRVVTQKGDHDVGMQRERGVIVFGIKPGTDYKVTTQPDKNPNRTAHSSPAKSLARRPVVSTKP